MHRGTCLLILVFGIHCRNNRTETADLGTGAVDLGTGPADLGTGTADLDTGLADLSTGPADLSMPVPTKVCSSDNWCWENPLPAGSDLFGVWAANANNVWAVGYGGTIL